MTILTFKYISGGAETTVDFDDYEVGRVRIVTNQSVILKRLQNRAPKLYYIYPEWRTITVELLQNKRDVSTRLETLKDITDIMTMLLYHQNGDVAEQIGVKINPNIVFPYKGGIKDAINLNFELNEVTSGKVAVNLEWMPLGIGG